MMNWVISSSVLTLVIIVFRAVLKGKISLRLQYGLWALVLVRLLFPFSIGETVVSVGTWLDSATDTIEGQQFEEFVQTPLRDMIYEGTFDSVLDDETVPNDVPSESVEIEIQNDMREGITPKDIAKIVWIVGVAVLGLWFLITNIHFALKLRKERVLIGNINGLSIYQAKSVETPCLYGLFRPAIYLTNEVVGQEERMHHVLEHECTHYRHRDYIWSVLRVVCLALHWYNPLVWCAAILSRNDAELACDEATIRRLGETERASYGRTLIGLTCEKRSSVLITATTMTGSGKSIKERIILIAKKPKMAAMTLAVVVLLAVVAVVWTYTGAKPQYENFSEWVDALDIEKFETFAVIKGYGNSELRYQGTKEDFEEFYEMLKSIPEEKCYRRKQTVEVHQDYYLYFYLDKKVVRFKCLEDKTILYVGETEMPRFAPEGKKLIIDSPKLWNYIVKTVSEKGTIGGQSTENNQNTENNQIIETDEEIIVENGYVQYVLNEMTADLNYDGKEDLVQTVLQIEEGRYDTVKLFSVYSKVQNAPAVIKVYLGTGIEGEYEQLPVYVSKEVYYSSPQGSGAYILTEKDGKDYLLYSNFQEVYEWAMYFYEVRDINENNELRIVENMNAQFVRDIFSKDWEEGGRREDVIPFFKKDMTPWIQNGKILIVQDRRVDPIFSYGGEVKLANSYYDGVWNRRNESEREKELEAIAGPEKWKQYILEQKRISFIENSVIPNVGEYYEEYDGSKLQRLDKYVHQGTNVAYSGSIPTNDEIVYYRANTGEDEQDAIYKMMECMIKARMIPDENRTCTYTDYAIPEQRMIPIAENMWLVPFLSGYYAFEGKDLVTMQEIIDAGEPVTEDGLVSFVAQGGDEQFYHILMMKEGVYRLERLDNMMNEQW